MNVELLVGGEEFADRFYRDVRDARDAVRVQTLSFEGDAAGLGLTRELLASPARDRRLLVDAYTRWILSDRFLYTPRARFDTALRAEHARTHDAVERLRSAGVGVRFTNPAGLFMRRIAARNHKKLALVDGNVAYLGGINFSEHNFAWHDMMLRFDDPALAGFLAADFDQTWEGRDQHLSARFGDVEVHLLNGRRSEGSFQTIFRVLDAARHEIHVHSPYLSFPFVERLTDARRRGVAVEIVTPERNNYRTLKDYLLWKAQAGGLGVRLFPERMMHLKAMLIDDEVLIIGSANFDWLSFAFCQEVVALIRDRRVIELFRRRVLEPDLAASARFGGTASAWRGRLAEAQLRTASRLLGAAARL